MNSGREPVAGGDNRSCRGRRAPVTQLNTDTYNFRAMVQQFRGDPLISFGAGGASGIGMPVRASPTSAIMSFDHLGGSTSRPAVMALLQQQLFRPQQYGDFGVLLGGGGGGDMFLHGFESSAEDRMLLQSIQVAQMMPCPVSTNNTNGYNIG